MDFAEYLKSKKIDADAFKKAMPEQWNIWNQQFGQMHPNSFTSQKLYLINDIRRAYTLKDEGSKEAKQTEFKAVSKPKVKPARPKTGAKPVMKRPKLK